MNAEYARRDRFVGWLANKVLRLASPRYQAMIKGSIRYGLIAAAMDEEGSMLAEVDAFIDREPLPTDGPDYHEEHAAWVRRHNT
jgi:hypothetical protein